MLHFKVTRSILSVNESIMTLTFVYSSYTLTCNSVSTLKWGGGGERLQMSQYILWTIVLKNHGTLLRVPVVQCY